MEFKPLLTPLQMLELGVFDGTYFKNDYSDFKEEVNVSSKNLFLEKASQPMSVWIENGWITPEDQLGWFQWYTRYYYGRRIQKLDEHQIKRWRSFTARHGAQVKKNGDCDLTQRTKQRQALLHWGCDPIPDVIDIEDKYEFLKEYKEQLAFCS
jgi:hypothetical protein